MHFWNSPVSGGDNLSPIPIVAIVVSCVHRLEIALIITVYAMHY